MKPTVDKRVFGQFYDEGWSETALVTSELFPDLLPAALGAASERFMNVQRSGREDADAAQRDDPDTPNYVNVAAQPDGSCELYVDCQNDVGGQRAAKFRKILVEELLRGGASDAMVRPRPDDLEEFAAPKAPDWVLHRDATMIGFPDTLRPAGPFTVVFENASVSSFTTKFGVEYDDVWSAQLGAVSSVGVKAAMDVVVAQVTASIGISDWQEREAEGDGVELTVWRGTCDWADVEIVGFETSGMRRKPDYLRGRSEGVLIGVLVIQSPNPNPSLP